MNARITETHETGMVMSPASGMKLISKFSTFQTPPSAALQRSQASSIDTMQLMDVLLHIVDFELRELKLICLVYAVLSIICGFEIFSLFSPFLPWLIIILCQGIDSKRNNM